MKEKQKPHGTITSHRQRELAARRRRVATRKRLKELPVTQAEMAVMYR